MFKLFRKKEPVYFDLDSYDCSSFAREVTEEELYLINGGGTMSSADQQAMAEACKNGNTEKQAEIKAKYETNGSSTTSTGAKGLATAASTSTAPTQTDAPSQPTALSHEQQDAMAKQDAERNTGGAGSSAGSYSGGGYSGQGGSSSSSGGSSKKSSGGKSYISALTDREQYEMALKDVEEKKSTDNASGSPCGTKVGGSGKIEYDPHNPNRILANLDDKKSLQTAAELLSDPNLGYTVTAYGEKSGCVRNFKNYAEINDYLYKDPNFPGAKVYEKLTYFHFEERDARNVITESFEDILSSLQSDGNWKLLPPALSKYHQNGLGTPELKFVCVDGREAVFTNDFSPTGKYELYTDPRYKGTYNYCDPTANPIGHFFADMLPYYLTGDKNERNQ